MSSADGLALRLKVVTARRAGAALALWGEAGIGKTHTVARLLSALPCRSLSLHAAQPLPGWPTALPRGERLPRWADRLLTRLSRAEHLGTEELVGALGAQLASCAPFVLHTEDMHEADSERLELLLALARAARRSRGVALLVTSRTEVPEPFEGFRLEPLGQRAVEALLHAEVSAALPQEALEWLYRRADGNPLYTLEYVRFLGRQGYLWSDGRRWHWRRPGDNRLMPATVEALIEQGLADVARDPTLAAALQARALLPLDAGDALLAEVADMSASALYAAKLELRRRGLFRDENFAHPLYRELTLETVGREIKRDLSRRAVRALQTQPERAVSFVEAADLEPETTLALFKAAAERSKEHSEVAAARFLAKAALYAGGRERGRLALQAAQTLSHVDVREAERLLELAAADETLRAEALFSLAELLASQGRREGAERVLERLSAAERAGPTWAARMVQIHSAANNDAGVLELLRTRPEVLAGDALTLSRIVRALAHDGRLHEGESLVQQRFADPKLGPRDRISLLKALSVIAYMRADFAEMERLESEVYSLARPLGDLRLMDAALYNRAIALGYLGRYAEQKASLEAALEVCRELGDLSAHVITQTAYADLLIDAADYEEAETLLHEAHAALRGVGLSAFLVGCEASLARLYESWRPLHGKLLALKHAAASLKEARKRNTASLLAEGLCAAARAEAWGGSAARAESLALEALERTRQLEMPAAHLNALDARARSLLAAGKTEAARAVFAEALLKAPSLGEAAVRLVALELARLDHNPKKAFESARDHAAWFRARGLMNGVNLAERYFPALAAAPPNVAANAPTGTLRLEVLGPLRFSRGGEVHPLRGRRRKALLASLVEASLAGRAQVSALDLLDALYPEEDERGAQGALKQLVFQVRAQLGPGVLTTTSNGYALGAVVSDAATFLETGDTTLWRGLYLEDAESSGETVREVLYGALRKRLIEVLEQNPTEAVRVGQLLIKADPYDLAALKVTLRALQKLNQSAELTRRYREGCARLLEVGEVLPAEVTAFLASDTV